MAFSLPAFHNPDLELSKFYFSALNSAQPQIGFGRLSRNIIPLVQSASPTLVGGARFDGAINSDLFNSEQTKQLPGRKRRRKIQKKREHKTKQVKKKSIKRKPKRKIKNKRRKTKAKKRTSTSKRKKQSKLERIIGGISAF